MIGEDYSYPYNQGGGFKRGFCRGGGEEVTTVWHPVPLDDYSSIIAQIPLDQGYDAVMYNGSGSDAVAFTKQWVDLGMVGKIPLIGQSNTFEQGDLPAMPLEAVEGALNAHHYAESLTNAEAAAFAQKYQEKYGRPPAAAAEFAYDVMRLILRAIEARGGDISDPAALVAAMKEVDQSDAPRGPLTLGEFNDVIENVYIREVQIGEDGKAFNKVLFYIPNVTQFGPYDKTLYMAQPPDSNSYPPDKCADFPAEMLSAENTYEFMEYK
jgi:branched-chain amino acid transport system substrate-binding protein